jgi:hypothetical protein
VLTLDEKAPGSSQIELKRKDFASMKSAMLAFGTPDDEVTYGLLVIIQPAWHNAQADDPRHHVEATMLEPQAA